MYFAQVIVVNKLTFLYVVIIYKPAKVAVEDNLQTRVFSNASAFMMWATGRAHELAMEVERVSLSELAPTWVVTEEKLARPDGQFFSVEGVCVVRSAGREVSGWSQPMMVQPTGYVGLIHWHENADLSTHEILVRVFPEPGNVGIKFYGKNTRVLVGPSFQFSPGNLENHNRAILGELDPSGKPYKRVPFAGLASEGDGLPEWSTGAIWDRAVEDGGRFFEKVNRYGLITTKDRESVEGEILSTGQPENFAWINIVILRDLFRVGYANGHLRSVSSLLL